MTDRARQLTNRGPRLSTFVRATALVVMAVFAPISVAVDVPLPPVPEAIAPGSLPEGSPPAGVPASAAPAQTAPAVASQQRTQAIGISLTRFWNG